MRRSSDFRLLERWKTLPKRARMISLAGTAVLVSLILGLAFFGLRGDSSDLLRAYLKQPAEQTSGTDERQNLPAMPATSAIGLLRASGRTEALKASEQDIKTLPLGNSFLTGPMVIRSAAITLVTKEFPNARAQMERMVLSLGGYIARLGFSGQANSGRVLQATLRVPGERLEAAMAALRQLGRVTGETQSGEEVTQQYVDLTARLENARHTEQRLIVVLEQRTGKVADVLEVEREIARVREEIERMDAQRRSFEKQVAFATISLCVQEEFQQQLAVAPPSTGTRLWNALVEGYRSAADGVIELALFLLRIAPSLLLWILIFAWPARLIWRRVRAVLAKPETVQTAA